MAEPAIKRQRVHCGEAKVPSGDDDDSHTTEVKELLLLVAKFRCGTEDERARCWRSLNECVLRSQDAIAVKRIAVAYVAELVQTAELDAPEDGRRLATALMDTVVQAVDSGSWEELCARPCNANRPVSAGARSDMIQGALFALRRLCVRQAAHPQARLDENPEFVATFCMLLENKGSIDGAQGVEADRFFIDTLADCFEREPRRTLPSMFAIVRRIMESAVVGSGEAWHSDMKWISSHVMVPFISILCLSSSLCARGTTHRQDDSEMGTNTGKQVYRESVLCRCEAACATLRDSFTGEGPTDELKRSLQTADERLQHAIKEWSTEVDWAVPVLNELRRLVANLQGHTSWQRAELPAATTEGNHALADAAWTGTLLKSGATVCKCKIGASVMQHGVYSERDAVTEPVDVTSTAGESVLNVNSRGDISQILNYVLSKPRSQYFVLLLEMLPTNSQKEEATKFTVALWERAKAGVVKLTRGRTMYVLPTSSSITKALGMADDAPPTSKSTLYAVVLHPDNRHV